MIMAAILALTLFHPGFCFDGAWKEANGNGETKGTRVESQEIEHERVKLTDRRKSSSRREREEANGW